MGSDVRGNSRKGTKRTGNSLENDTGEPKRTRARKTPKVAPVDGDTSTEEKGARDGPELGRTKAMEAVTPRPKHKSPLQAGAAIPRTGRFAKKAADSKGSSEAGPSTTETKTGAVRKKSVSPSPSSGCSSANTVRSAHRKGSRRRSRGKSLEPGGATKPSGRGRKRSRSSRGRKGHSRSRRQSSSISSVCSVAGKRVGKRSPRSRSKSSRRTAGRKHGGNPRHHSTSTGSESTTPKKGRKSGRRSKSRSGNRRRTQL